MKILISSLQEIVRSKWRFLNLSTATCRLHFPRHHLWGLLLVGRRGENVHAFPIHPSICRSCEATALANKRWVPPPGEGSLHIRPLLMGSGPVLGLGPAPECTFLIYATPVGHYFKEGLAPSNLFVEDEYHRATRGGTGGVKSITNYSPDDVISTPAANGSLLEGVNRKCIIDIALDHGYQVMERCIPVEESVEADEVFCTGTAAGVAAVGSIRCQGKRVEYSQMEVESTTVVQRGQIQDKKGWVLEIDQA